MPIIRKVIAVGDSRAVTIPHTWLKYYERELGRPIKEVAIEVNRDLKISPLPTEKPKQKKSPF